MDDTPTTPTSTRLATGNGPMQNHAATQTDGFDDPPLFPPNLISPEVSSSLPDGYTMRPLRRSDYHGGFLPTLRVLTTVGEPTLEEFNERYDFMASRNDTYYILVICDSQNAVVGTGAVIVERKFIHNLGLVGHIEDIAVAKDQQGKKLGLRLIQALDYLAKEVGCYKSILDCSEANEGFYVKCGYRRAGLEMAHYYEKGPKTPYERALGITEEAALSEGLALPVPFQFISLVGGAEYIFARATPPPKLSLSPPFMDGFAFITETDGSSGKVASTSARKLIRTHVMRTHWANKTGLCDQEFDICASNQRERTKERMPATLERRTCPAKPTVSSTETLGRDCSARLQPRSLPNRDPAHAESPSRHLLRGTDAFVYAGSSIDLKSYGFFSHYSSEFRVVLCNPIQPFPLDERSLSCSTAIQENSPALLHAICFTAAGHEAAARDVCPNPLSASKPSHPISSTLQDALRYKGVSLNLLTRDLTQHPHVVITEASILCVTLHLTAEAAVGDSTALAAHSNGLKRIVELFGGPDLLSPDIATHVQLADIKTAEVRQKRSSFLLRDHLRCCFDNLSAQPFLPSDSSLSLVGSQFLAEPLRSNLSPALRKCIQYARHLVGIAEQYQIREPVPGTYSLDSFLTLEHVLLSLPYEQSLSKADECIRLALLLYANTALWKIPLYFAWVVSLVKTLKAALLSLDWQYVTKDQLELFLWIFLLGRHAASSSQGENETSWWNMQLRLVALVLGVLKWEEARATVKRFFYVDRVSSKSWEAVWQTAVLGAVEEGISLPAGKHPCDYYC